MGSGKSKTMNDRTTEFDFQEIAERSTRAVTVGALHLVLGESPGKLILLDASSLTLGRGEACDLRFQVEGLSRMHARITQKEDEYVICDLQSTNGLFVNGFMTLKQALRDGDRVALGPNLVFCFRLLQIDEAMALEAVSASQARDPITGALTLDYFQEMLRFELELGQKRGFDVAVLCVHLAEGNRNQDLLMRDVASYLEGQRKAGSLLGRPGALRFMLTMAYTAKGEVERWLESLDRGLRNAFPQLNFALGAGYSRELATPGPTQLIDAASRLRRS